MWVPKFVRDEKMGVDTPFPTQAVSNEEFIPRPISKQQRQVEALIMENGEKNAKKLGMDRRKFMRTSMGLATALMASNQVFGPHFEVDAQEQFEPAATDEKWPKGEYFVFDVQAHFTESFALPGFRNAEFLQNMGVEELKADKEAYSFTNFIKEMFFDSETSMVVISGVPGRENQYDRKGNPLEGKKRGGGILPSWYMSQSKKKLNEMANSQRSLCQGNCAPNHYWDRTKNEPDWPALYDQIEKEVKEYGIDSWKWYCHTDPGRSGNGFQIDDDNAQKFIEKSRELGIKTISTHKGFSYQSRKLGHLANPKDIEKAALRNPDFTFVVYHSALKHGPNEPNYAELNQFEPTTGDFLWHEELMNIKRRNPDMENVYCEIGSSFGLLNVAHPDMCQHLMGKNIKYYGIDHVVWGTDCLWWGTPQPFIEMLKRFQFTPEFQDKFGYAPLTKEDKAKIFGLNAAKIYGVDVNEQRNAIKYDDWKKLETAYVEQGNLPSNRAYGWVRAEA